MGSAGFLVETARYLNEHHHKELLRNDVLEHFRHELFHGFDTDQTMLRIGVMNLLLHGVNDPGIAWQDSLSSDNADTDRYTLCLANPPFPEASTKERSANRLRSWPPRARRSYSLFPSSSACSS